MPTLMVHRDVIYEDDTVYMSGHAYFNCTFRRCTMVMTDMVGEAQSCNFDGCVFHINMIINDVSKLETMFQMLEFMREALPTLPVNPVGVSSEIKAKKDMPPVGDDCLRSLKCGRLQRDILPMLPPLYGNSDSIRRYIYRAMLSKFHSRPEFAEHYNGLISLNRMQNGADLSIANF